ncbi:MAG: hypothetical protein LR015_05965 [Verrucomicrobia bacterium]|nr:hypothetical protein [Verrucomicrobiota bacterium]
MEAFIEETLKIWMDGGMLMLPLAFLAGLIYFTILAIYFELSRRRFAQIDNNLWRHWVDKPDEGQGELGDIIRFLDQNTTEPAQLRAAVAAVKADYLPRVNSRIRFGMILVTAAPLTVCLAR